MNTDKLLELAQQLPEVVRQNAIDLVTRMGTVIEGIGDEGVAWRAPMAKLMQAVSDRSKFPKGATPGDILVGENLLKKPLPVIPLLIYDGRQFWSPDQNEEKMLCYSPDAKLGVALGECKTCPHSVFDEEAKKIDCNKIKTVMNITGDLSELFSINFAKTGYKIGTEWEKNMKKAGVAPFRRQYSLSSETSKQYKNVESYLVETYATDDKKNTPVEYLPFLQELFNQIRSDRKDFIDNFHRIVLARKPDQALLGTSNADSEMVLIETTVEAISVATEKEAPVKGTKYVM